MKPGSRFSGSELTVCLLLAAVALLVFLPVRHHSFLLFDDADYVTDNRMVQAGLTWSGASWAFTSFHSANWHPLTWLSHMLDVELFGRGATGPHLVNVLLHVANTVLLLLLMQRLTGALWRSAFVAALFALHPLHVESVAWIAERKDVLSALFFLLTLWAYANYAQRRSLAPLSSKLNYTLALLLFALGLMSKPMLVTLPFVLLLLDYWPLQRLTISESPSTIHNPPSTIPLLVWEKIPFFLLSALSCVVTFAAQKQSGVVRSLVSFSLVERIENALVSYARYLGKIAWPADLAAFYPHPGHWPAGQAIFAAVLIAGLCFASLWWSRRAPFVVTGWLWFLGMLVPTIGLVQVSDQSMADRYTYLPSIGVFIVVAWGASAIATRWQWPRAALATAAGLAVVACSLRTHFQLRHWHDNESLFRHALAVTEKNFAAHYNLAAALLEKGRLDEAIAHFEETLEISPKYADAHCNFGNALLRKDRVDDAIAHFRQALEIQPNHGPARCNLGITLLQRGQADEATAHFKKALEATPQNVTAHFNLGNVLLQQGQIDAAIAHYRKVLEIHFDHADTHNNLGAALLQKGNADEALTHFQKTLAIRPDHANASNNLADLFLQRGQLDEAIARYKNVLALQPGNAGAHCNLGTALLLKGLVDEALTHFKETLKIQPGFAQAHNNLGFILLQKGRAREAVTHLHAAADLQPDNARTLASLAWVLATCPDDSVRDGAKAIELAKRASLLSDNRDPEMLRPLAAAYAEGGHFADAAATAGRALQLAESQSNATLAGALRSQLKLYQAGAPFRDTVSNR